VVAADRSRDHGLRHFGEHVMVIVNTSHGLKVGAGSGDARPGRESSRD
jgi:hypothetical protein